MCGGCYLTMHGCCPYPQNHGVNICIYLHFNRYFQFQEVRVQYKKKEGYHDGANFAWMEAGGTWFMCREKSIFY